MINTKKTKKCFVTCFRHFDNKGNNKKWQKKKQKNILMFGKKKETNNNVGNFLGSRFIEWHFEIGLFVKFQPIRRLYWYDHNTPTVTFFFVILGKTCMWGFLFVLSNFSLHTHPIQEYKGFSSPLHLHHQFTKQNYVSMIFFFLFPIFHHEYVK